MNEDPTKRFADGESFEARVLSELRAIRAEQAEMRREMRAELTQVRAELTETRKDIVALDSRIGSVEDRLTSVEGRLTSFEDRVDARLRETRPFWEAVQEDIKRLDVKFDEVIRDFFDVRTGLRSHEKRLYHLENIR